MLQVWDFDALDDAEEEARAKAPPAPVPLPLRTPPAVAAVAEIRGGVSSGTAVKERLFTVQPHYPSHGLTGNSDKGTSFGAAVLSTTTPTVSGGVSTIATESFVPRPAVSMGKQNPLPRTLEHEQSAECAGLPVVSRSDRFANISSAGAEDHNDMDPSKDSVIEDLPPVPKLNDLLARLDEEDACCVGDCGVISDAVGNASTIDDCWSAAAFSGVKSDACLGGEPWQEWPLSMQFETHESALLRSKPTPLRDLIAQRKPAGRQLRSKQQLLWNGDCWSLPEPKPSTWARETPDGWVRPHPFQAFEGHRGEYWDLPQEQVFSVQEGPAAAMKVAADGVSPVSQGFKPKLERLAGIPKPRAR